MEFDRFKKIIENNKIYQEEINHKIKDFHSKIDMSYERELLNVIQIVRPLFEKKKYLLIEMPFKNKEIGALCYRGDYCGYIFLNSALSKVNISFALCHEIYHIFYQEQQLKKEVELYMNSHYFEQKEELLANLFAGILLMPEQSFKSMFRKFSSENSKDDTNISLLAKLMNYFEVPYMAVFIRCYELELLQDGDDLKNLLLVNSEQILEEFSRLWLNEDILKPTNKDDYSRLKILVQKVRDSYCNEEILNKRTVDKVLTNIENIYSEIRG